MLINDFFEILESNNDTLSTVVKVKLNPQHAIFAGHFPDNPVTPGVVLIQMVKEVLEDVLSKKLKLLSMARCKFLKVLDPRETPEFIIKLEIKEEGALMKVNASGGEGEQLFFKLSAVYQ